MPKKTLPKGYPDPMDLIRDPGWETNYPMLILRGIYGIMDRERKTGRGSITERYIKAFNIIIMTMAKKSQPRRIRINKGMLELTSFGEKRNQMILGGLKFDEAAKRRYGNKTKADIIKENKKKMKQLRIWINILVHELPDAQPVSSPTRIP